MTLEQILVASKALQQRYYMNTIGKDVDVNGEKVMVIDVRITDERIFVDVIYRKKFICFCNECGSKRETDNIKEYEFCPDCGHVNTGFCTNKNYKEEDLE